jgi:predicted TIM-barrel fold metal-dependent hydrolase
MAYIARANENVWVDISGSSTRLYKSYLFEFYRKMAYLKVFVPEKILFSTDWPGTTSLQSLKESVDLIRNLKLPASLKGGGLTEWSEEDKRRILGENAARLLGLK